MLLRLHSLLSFSRANGPGARAVVWTQGCSLGCPGCFNPETHAFHRDEGMAVGDLFERFQSLRGSVEGLTVSGGEPFQQLRPLTALLRRVRCETNLSVIVFTGFTWEEILQMGGRRGAEDLTFKSKIQNPKPEMAARPKILDYVDVLIAGRYDAHQRFARGLRGSVNKTVHFLTDRYRPADLDAVPEAEAFIGMDGNVTASGIEPVLA